MLKNYLKIMMRNLWKHRGYSSINIIGLAIGLACFILISLWVSNELSYDKFHGKIDRLYRVNTELPDGRIIPNSSLKLGKEMKMHYPEIESYTNFIPWARSLVKYENKSYDENNIYLVDPAFFSMFTFNFIAGDSSNPLPDNYSLVMTDETSKKYFGNENPIGKSVYSNVFERSFIVTAVVKKMPSNSTLQFNIAASINLMPLQRRDSWEFSGWTYVLLNKNVAESEFENKIKNFYSKYVESDWTASLKLQNYATLHLYENGKAELVKLVYVFSIVAILILIIACINFMNLSTARATKRALEVGVRKVIGAQKKQLIIQFLSESVFTAFLAAIIALLFVEIMLPGFNNFTGKSLTLWDVGVVKFILGFSVVILFVGIFAGVYPAFILSSFKTVSVLKGQDIHSFSGGMLFRKILIIGQFIVSISLIICALIVKEQMDFVLNTDLGMNRKMVVTLPNNIELTKRFDAYKSNLSLSSGVLDVSASATQPFDVNQRIPINWEGHMNEEAVDMRYTMVDYDFFKTLEMKIIKGRGFSQVFSTDSTRAVIINESAAAVMGFKNPIGKIVYFGHPAFPEDKREVKIIGVVKDFHFNSLHSPIGPFIFKIYRPWCSNIFIKLGVGNLKQTLAGIEIVTKNFAPDYPFKYEFLDDTYSRLYLMETKISQLANIFAVLAIILSCLGLFGLAAYTAEQKTKEIGIRKVLGLSLSGIVLLLSKEFIKWVAVANLVAWPIAYYTMHNWLKDFIYKINISPWIFLFAGTITLVITLLTVGSIAIRAANANPVESLKYE